MTKIDLTKELICIAEDSISEEKEKAELKMMESLEFWEKIPSIYDYKHNNKIEKEKEEK